MEDEDQDTGGKDDASSLKEKHSEEHLPDSLSEDESRYSPSKSHITVPQLEQQLHSPSRIEQHSPISPQQTSVAAETLSKEEDKEDVHQEIVPPKPETDSKEIELSPKKEDKSPRHERKREKSSSARRHQSSDATTGEPSSSPTSPKKVSPQSAPTSGARKAVPPTMSQSMLTSQFPTGVAMAIEEMRRYYESEIAVLRRQVQGIYGENAVAEDSLLKRCHALEAQLRSATNEAEVLREQVNGMKSQMESWPARVHELECERDNLRIRLDEVRQCNQQKEQEILDAQEKMRTLEEKQVWSQGPAPHDHILLQRMMEEYDSLVKDYDMVKSALLSTEQKLFNSRSELSDQTRKMAQMELDLCKVESENNFLRRRVLQDRDRTASSPTKNVSGWYLSKAEGMSIPGTTYDRDFAPVTQLFKERSRASVATAERDGSPMFGAATDAADTLGKISHDGTDERLTRHQGSRASMRAPMRSLSVAKTTILPTSDMSTTHYSNRSGTLPGALRSSIRSPSADRAVTINPHHQSYEMDIPELRQRYDEMHMRKRKLETALSHLPTNSRNKHQVRQQKEQIEEQLDHIDHDLGSLRMTLRQYNAL